MCIRDSSWSVGTYHIAVTRQSATDNEGAITGSACDGNGMSFMVPSSTIVFQPDGNYEDNQQCYWRINCPDGAPIIDFTEFDTESDWDFVRVYMGTETSGTQLGELTGALVDLPATHFQSMESSMTVEFESDESITAGGFQARFNCA